MSDLVKVEQSREYDTDTGKVKLSPGSIRKYLVSGGGQVTEQEVATFMALCYYQKLNPFLREAYLIKYGDNSPASMVVGKEVFVKRAAKNQDFDGFEAGVVLSIDGQLVYRPGSLVLETETLAGGWATVHRKNQSVPIKAVVSLAEYIGRKKDGTVSKQWQKMPGTMIRKVALVQALREAFTQDLGALYDQSEIVPDGEELPIEPINVTEIPKEETADYGLMLLDLQKDPLLTAGEKDNITKFLDTCKTNIALRSIYDSFRKTLDERKAK